MKKKLESYGHQEYNQKEIKDDLEKKLKENKDFANRGYKFWTSESGLPEFIIKNKIKYKNLIK